MDSRKDHIKTRKAPLFGSAQFRSVASLAGEDSAWLKQLWPASLCVLTWFLRLSINALREPPFPAWASHCSRGESG